MDENEKQLNDHDIKVLRTYTSDMADAIRTNEVSVIKIALAEKEKREQEELYRKAEGSKFSKVLLVIGGIILIIGAIVGSYLLYQKKKADDTLKPLLMTNVDTFLSYDSKSYIDTTNVVTINDLLGVINQGSIGVTQGLINALFLTKMINNVPELITSKDFLSLIQSTAPDALTRSLTDKFLLGKYSNPNAANERSKSGTFLILETTDYNQAYASMISWENTMLKDLFVLFKVKVTGTDDPLFEKQWKDIIINNRDARVLYGEDGTGILYYVFINKNDLLITDNIEALKEVTSRLVIKNTQPL